MALVFAFVCDDVELLTPQAVLQPHILPTSLLALLKALARKQAELHWQLHCLFSQGDLTMGTACLCPISSRYSCFLLTCNSNIRLKICHL